jgi:ABC-type nickel/cobalt efflux system permease component RcnA
MRALKFSVLIAACAGLVWLFGFGGIDDIARWAAAQQRGAQNALAAGLRAVRAGQPGAWISLMGVCAAYGFFHAAGPGHGKLVIGGYGAAARVTAWRLSALALAASLAQAVAAIALVGLGALVLGWGRAEMTQTAEQVLAPASYAAIALVGAWLVVRGLRRGFGAAAHPVDADGHCGTCGHAHGPSVDQVEGLSSWRDAVAIIGSIAIRPCTGAVFLLILCFGLGIPWAGIAGALVMGLGTASVTVLVALVAVGTRRTALAGWSGSGAERAMAAIEVAAGGLIALIAVSLVLPFL